MSNGFTKNFKQEVNGVLYDTKTAKYRLSYNATARVYETKDGKYFFHCIEGDREWIKPCTSGAVEDLIMNYGMKGILVDGRTYKTKKEALAFFEEAIAGTDGSEQERMMFAWQMIKEGCTVISTYSQYATKPLND